jgi:hypothetical protein
LIGNGRDQVDSAALGLREHQYGRLAAWRVAARVMFDRTEGRLISPTDFGPLGLGAFLDSRP